jgi:two-component system response regulator AtoC
VVTPPPRVLVIDDHRDTAEWLQLILERHGCDVRVAPDGRTGELLCAVLQPDLVFLDLGLPDIDGIDVLRRARDLCRDALVAVCSGLATVPRVVEAMSAGAFTVLEKPINDTQVVDLLDRVRARIRMQQLDEEVDADVERLGRLVTQCAPMKHVFDLVRMTAPADVNVLILGENGTGKELVASAIHDLSLRRTRPFIRINCASIPSELLESELFGHRRGAFTGAVADKRGLLELADHGSVLLDEIAEMPALLQAKLMRVLQEREVRPVGSSASLKVDFRLISATNMDPKAAIAEGRFREDLLFRINTITLRVPPLRERGKDIPLLSRIFLRHFATVYHREIDGFADEVLVRFQQYHWPGNVRELEHAVERAVIVAGGRTIVLKDLPDSIRARDAASPRQPTTVPRNCTLEQLERLAILQALEQTNWNKRAAAHILGIHRPTLYNKLRKYQLHRQGRLPETA